jgi:hypothetical protein
MAKKELLLLAWEYEGHHSAGGAALSRRIRQIAGSFIKNNWNVTVIHKDQTSECGSGKEFIVDERQDSLKRIVVKDDHRPPSPAPLRKIKTLFDVTFHGDKSYYWAKKVIRLYPQFHNTRPDLIIACYSPRGPLFLGNYLSRATGTEWIADLQDNFDDGMSAMLQWSNRRWMKHILQSARAVVQVSAEWAERDGKMLDRRISVIRHAIPERHPCDRSQQHTALRIFYGGSLSEHSQSLVTIAAVLNGAGIPKDKIELHLATPESVADIFRAQLDRYLTIKHLGWLDRQAYAAAICQCDCCLVVPWSAAGRQVVPSKFYELCSFDKPIWIAGDDTGAFSTLFREMGHPDLHTGDKEAQQKALVAAMDNNFDLMFRLDKCKEQYVTENMLFDAFTRLL